MPIVITYDVSDAKQQEFKKWLIQNKEWLNSEPKVGGITFPESTLMKAGTSNGNQDVLQAKADMIEAATQVNTDIEAAIVISTQSALLIFKWPDRFGSLF